MADLPKKRYIIRLDETAIVGPQGPKGDTGATGAGGSLPIDASDVTYTGNGYTNEPLNNVLNDLLYVAPDITSFTADSGNNFEKGTVLTSLPVSWSRNKDVTAQTITGSNLTPPTLTASQTSVTLTLSSITDTQNVTLTIDDGTNTDVQNLSLNFLWPVFYGQAADPGAVTSDWLRNSLQFKVLRSDRNVSFSTTAVAGQYAWVAFPISYGIPSFTENGFSASWVQEHGSSNPFAHVTSQGADSSDTGTWPSAGGGYFVYRSENTEQAIDIVVL